MKNQGWGTPLQRFKKPFNSNNEVLFELGMGGKILRGNVVLSGAITIVNAGAAGAARFAEHIYAGLVKRIIVETVASNGRYTSGVKRDLSGAKLLRRAMFFRKKFLSELKGVVGSGAAGTYNIYLSFPIFFAQPDLKRPIETALNADIDAAGNGKAYSSIKVRVQCGDKTTTMNGNAGVWDFSALNVEWYDHREAVDGDTYEIVEIEKEFLIPGASTQQTDDTWESQGDVLDFIFSTQTGSSGAAAGPVYADTILNRIVVESDTADFDLFRDELHQLMYDYDEIDTAQAFTGVHHVNFVTSGMLSKCPRAGSCVVKYDVLNPSGSNLDSINVITRRKFKPAGFVPIQFGQKGRGSNVG
jgi:hypothetical protein